MNLISDIKNKLKIFFQFFTTSSKSNTIQISEIRAEAHRLIKTKPEKIVKVKSIHDRPKPQLVKVSKTIKTEPIPETEQLTIENFCPKIITLNPNNLKNFEPGYVFDTNVHIHFEDYSDLFKVGKKINEKLSNKPIYILSQIELEFRNKRCPINYKELVIDHKYTGRKRDFNEVLNKLPESFGANIYLVNITKSEEIKNKAQEYLSDYEKYGLHEADSIFLAFAKLTKSTLVTCDKELLRCCSLAQCEFIEFQGFLEKVCQPSPITKMLRDRRNYRRNYYKKLGKYQHHDHWGICN